MGPVNAYVRSARVKEPLNPSLKLATTELSGWTLPTILFREHRSTSREATAVQRPGCTRTPRRQSSSCPLWVSYLNPASHFAICHLRFACCFCQCPQFVSVLLRQLPWSWNNCAASAFRGDLVRRRFSHRTIVLSGNTRLSKDPRFIYRPAHRPRERGDWPSTWHWHLLSWLLIDPVCHLSLSQAVCRSGCQSVSLKGYLTRFVSIYSTAASVHKDVQACAGCRLRP